MFKSLLTVSGWTMLSRVLGLVREMQLAALLGAGPVQDAYQVALRLPNMFRRLFGEGAFNAAFVPQFTGLLKNEGQERARIFAAEMLGGLTIWLMLLCAIGELCMPGLVWLLDYAHHDDPTRARLIATLTYITLPYMVLICATALVSGALNGMHRFGMAAAAYAAFNVVGIAVTWIGARFFHAPALFSAWGVTISGAVQLGLVLYAAHRAGLRLWPHWPRWTPDARILVHRMVPGLIGSGATQINLLVDTVIALQLPTGTVSWLTFADRMNQLPLGVLGAAAATTLLPVLSRHVAAGEEAEGRAAIARALDNTAILTLPAAFGLLSLAPVVMAGVFEHGRFTANDVLHSAGALQAYTLGLPAYVAIKVLTPGFYAHGDTKTPMRIGFVAIAVNLCLNLALYRPLAEIGPPLASAIAAWTNLAIIATVLYRRGHFALDTRNVSRLVRTALAALAMGGILRLTQHNLASDIVDWSTWSRLLTLVAFVTTGGVLYLGFLAGLGVAGPRAVLSKLRRRKAR